MEIVDLIERYAFTGIQNAEGQAFFSRLILIDFQRDFPNLRGCDRVLDQQQQNAAQGVTVATAFIVGAKVVFDQQLQTLALNRRQNVRHHFVNQILNGEQRWLAFPGIILQNIRQLNFIYHTHQNIRLVRQLLAFRRVCGSGVDRQYPHGFFQGIANILHKRGAALLVFLIQTLRLPELFVHQHFPVLIANNKDLRARGDLAAEQANFI